METKFSVKFVKSQFGGHRIEILDHEGSLLLLTAGSDERAVQLAVEHLDAYGFNAFEAMEVLVQAALNKE